MFETVVLALDGSESSDRALEFATRLAKEQASTVRVVHIVELIAGRGVGPVRIDEDEVRAKIARQVAELVAGGIDAELEVHSEMSGGPARVIAESAERAGADVIVAGSRGHTAFAGILLGSVTQRLLHVARCPVIVVPETTAPQAAASESSANVTAGG